MMRPLHFSFVRPLERSGNGTRFARHVLDHERHASSTLVVLVYPDRRASRTHHPSMHDCEVVLVSVAHLANHPIQNPQNKPTPIPTMMCAHATQNSCRCRSVPLTTQTTRPAG